MPNSMTQLVVTWPSYATSIQCWDDCFKQFFRHLKCNRTLRQRQKLEMEPIFKCRKENMSLASARSNLIVILWFQSTGTTAWVFFFSSFLHAPLVCCLNAYAWQTEWWKNAYSHIEIAHMPERPKQTCLAGVTAGRGTFAMALSTENAFLTNVTSNSYFMGRWQNKISKSIRPLTTASRYVSFRPLFHLLFAWVVTSYVNP